jgi:hypothetical protein
MFFLPGRVAPPDRERQHTQHKNKRQRHFTSPATHKQSL